MRPRLATADDRRQCWFDCIDLQRRPGLLQYLGAGRDMTASADACDQHVYRIFGKVFQDFLRRRFRMHCDVGRILELLGHPAPGDRKSTRLNSITNAHLVCRLLLAKKNIIHYPTAAQSTRPERTTTSTHSKHTNT